MPFMHRVWLAAASSPQSGRSPSWRAPSSDCQSLFMGSASGTP